MYTADIFCFLFLQRFNFLSHVYYTYKNKKFFSVKKIVLKFTL